MNDTAGSGGRGLELSARAQAAAEAPGGGRVKVEPIKQLLPYVMRYRGRVIAAFIALVVAALTTLVVPIAVRRMVDFGFSAEGVEMIDSYFLVMIGVAAVLAVASAMRYYLVTTLGERIVADLRAQVFGHLTALSPAFFDRSQSGELLSRLTADTTQIKSAVGASVSIALRNLVLFFGAAIMMVVTSPKLSAFVLGAIPLIVLPLVGFGRAVRRRSRMAQDTLADASAFASEQIGAVRTMQAYTHERPAVARFTDAVERAYRAAQNSTLARALLTAIAIFLVFASVVVVLWVGAQDVLAGRMSAGRLSQFVLYAVFAAGGLGELSQVWGEISAASGAAERLFEIMQAEPAIKAPARPAALPVRSRGEVAFDNVHFSYPTRPETSALHGITFQVRAGEKVAIVGPSGAGKSTIFHLILRFYDPTSGTVSIDGVRADAVDPRELRRRIALVPQDTAIFSVSVARKHPLRPARGDGCGGRARRGSGGRRRLHPRAAARLRHAGRRARRHAVRRPASAHRYRARDPARRAAAAARRGDIFARRRERNFGAEGAGAADAGAHHAGDRAPARDGAALRPHPGAGPGPHRRRRHARESGGTRRPLCSPRQAAVRRRLGLPGQRLAAAFRAQERMRMAKLRKRFVDRLAPPLELLNQSRAQLLTRLLDARGFVFDRLDDRFDLRKPQARPAALDDESDPIAVGPAIGPGRTDPVAALDQAAEFAVAQQASADAECLRHVVDRKYVFHRRRSAGRIELRCHRASPIRIVWNDTPAKKPRSQRAKRP